MSKSRKTPSFFLLLFLKFSRARVHRSLSLFLRTNAILLHDAATRALRCRGSSVASLARDSSATNGDDDASSSNLAIVVAINPFDLPTFFAAPPQPLRLFLLLFLLLRVDLGLRGGPEGVRSNDARLRGREQLVD